VGSAQGETTARKNIIKRPQPKQKRLRIQLLTGEKLRKVRKIFLSRRIARIGGKETYIPPLIRVAHPLKYGGYKKAPAGHQRQGLKG
jgi:hypothetical protein